MWPELWSGQVSSCCPFVLTVPAVGGILAASSQGFVALPPSREGRQGVEAEIDIISPSNAMP